MIRKPLVSGQFYESSFNELDKQIKWCFESEFGPGDLPVRRRDKEIIGIISPHAGFPYSGPAAAWSFKEIAESKMPDLFILFGLSHSGFGSCISVYDWETPFGIVKNDVEFARKLIKNSDLKVDEEAHANEHSIEVQLPFLQFATKDYNDKLKICPVIVSPDKNFKDIAKSIYETLKETKKKAILIASSDFTHFGFNYGFFPFKTDIKENLYKLDKGAIEAIKKLSPEELLDYASKTTICGSYPIAAMLELANLLGAKKAELLQYYTSGDIIGDYGSAVGYGAVVVK